MRYTLLPLTLLVLLSVSLISDVGTVAAQANEHWTEEHVLSINTGVRSGCVNNVNIQTDTFTIPANNYLVGVYWEYNVTIHDTIGGTWMRLFWSVYNRSANTTTGFTSAGGSAFVRTCGNSNLYSSSGNCVTFFGMSPTLTLGNFAWSPTVMDWTSRYEINCGSSRQASLTNVKLTFIYYGVKPPGADFTWYPNSEDRYCAGMPIAFQDTSVGTVTSWSWNFGDEVGLSSDQNPFYTFSEPGSYMVQLVVNNGASNIFYIVAIESCAPDTPVYVRPFRANDELLMAGNDWGDVNTSIFEGMTPVGYIRGALSPELTVIALTWKGSQVHSARPGTVSAIIPMTENDCGTRYGQGNTCFAFLTDHNLIAKQYDYPIAGVYKVIVRVSLTEELHYIVTNPYEYVSVGDVIDAGCPIGEAVDVVTNYSDFGNLFYQVQDIFRNIFGAVLSLEVVDNFIAMVTPAQIPDRGGFTILYSYTLIEGDALNGVWSVTSILPSLIEYPEAQLRGCESSCFNRDPSLGRSDAWIASGVQWWTGGGVVIDPGGSIEAQLNLSSDVAYRIDVKINTMGTGSGAVRIMLGLSSYDFSVTSSGAQALQTPLETHSPDYASLFYTASIRNTGNSPVFVSRFCVSDGEIADGSTAGCTFTNYSFDGQPSYTGWTTSESGVIDGVTPGNIWMYNGATIAQNVKIFPDGSRPAIAYLTVTIGIRGASEEALAADSSTVVIMEYEYPTGSGWKQINNGITVTPASFYSPYNPTPGLITLSVPLNITSVVDGSLTIRVTLTGNTDLIVLVDEACLNNPLANGDGPYPVGCNPIAAPQDELLSSWTVYLWAHFDSFFTCELMIVFNRTYNVIEATWNLIGWQARYWQAAAINQAMWLSSDLFPWLNGHFRNMAVGQVTTVENSGGASIWDVLLALVNNLSQVITKILDFLDWLIRQVVELIGTVVYALIALILIIITEVLNLALLARSILEAILIAFNTATPTPIPGMPLCATDPRSSSWCISVWVLDNTLWSGPGAIIIPLIVGILSIHLLLWVVGEIKRSIIDMGKTA
jgi:PKD repeat protein